MQHILLAIFLTIGAGAINALAETQRRPEVPDFGLILNEDGNIIFAIADADPAVCAKHLQQALSVMKQFPIRTLAYNIACGSDIMDYPTKAGSNWGWRKTKDEETEPWKTRLAKLRPAAEAGLDNLRTAGNWAKANGLLFVPSYRMNDAHFAHDPHGNMHTGKFWVENHEKVTLKASPIPGRDTFQHLLDFSHPEVREYRLAIIREACDRYADVMDGFQLDFMRHPALFPAEATQQQTELITEMIKQVRNHLDELGTKNNRFYALMVRVPPTLKHSRWVGLDVKTWLEQRLVDVVTPSQAITLSHDMAVDEFVAIAEPVGAKVYPALLDRTQFAWPFVAAPDAQSYSGTVTWDTPAQLARGAVINLRAMGAAGFELYNYNLPLSQAGAKETVEAAAQSDPVAGERVYAVTPRYNVDDTDTYEPKKQIPAVLSGEKPAKLKLYVGEDVGRSASSAPLKLALRLGLAGRGEDKKLPSSLTVKLNGHELLTGTLSSDKLTIVTGAQTTRSKHVPPPVQAYVQMPIHDASMLNRGWNEIVIEIPTSDGDSKYTLCELCVGVIPGQ